MTGPEALLLADEAGLRYVEAGAPGYRRVRRGKGFSYVDDAGAVVNGRVRERIETLVIPPAWEDVWISSDPRGHILATGHDRAGRKQYIYHPKWEETRDEVKFDRLGPFGRRLPDLRGRVDSDLRGRGLSRQKVIALTVAMLDRTLVRVGNRKYAVDNEAYGLTTLTCEHVDVEGNHVHLEFAGKGGADRQLVLSDRRLAGLVARCQELEGQTLFSYESHDGDVASVSSTDVNAYLSVTMRGLFTAKDFRTWGASTLVLGELARADTPDDDSVWRATLDLAAERLGNTREVCRDSYVHPLIEQSRHNGALEEVWRRARPGKWIDRDESALRLLIDDPPPSS